MSNVSENVAKLINMGFISPEQAEEMVSMKEEKNMENTTMAATTVNTQVKKEEVKMTKEMIRAELEKKGIVISNTEFKATKKAELEARLAEKEMTAEEKLASMNPGFINATINKEESVIVPTGDLEITSDKYIAEIAKKIDTMTVEQRRELRKKQADAIDAVKKQPKITDDEKKKMGDKYVAANIEERIKHYQELGANSEVKTNWATTVEELTKEDKKITAEEQMAMINAPKYGINTKESMINPKWYEELKSMTTEQKKELREQQMKKIDAVKKQVKMTDDEKKKMGDKLAIQVAIAWMYQTDKPYGKNALFFKATYNTPYKDNYITVDREGHHPLYAVTVGLLEKYYPNMLEGKNKTDVVKCVYNAMIRRGYCHLYGQRLIHMTENEYKKCMDVYRHPELQKVVDSYAAFIESTKTNKR